MQNLFKILITGLIFVSLNFSTAEAQLMIDHPCYDIDPTKRDGHACWSKGEHPSENVVKLNTSNAELEYELSAARDALTTSERISTSQECAFKFEKGDGMAPHIARERICKDIIDRFEKKSREASCWAAGHRDCE